MSPSGIYRGVVARVTAGAVYVTVGRLTGPAHELGPVTIAQGPWTAGLTTEVGAGPDAHVHGLGGDLAKGDRVLVAFVEGRANDVVVLARLP